MQIAVNSANNIRNIGTASTYNSSFVRFSCSAKLDYTVFQEVFPKIPEAFRLFPKNVEVLVRENLPQRSVVSIESITFSIYR